MDPVMADPTDDTAAQKTDLAMRIALIMGLFLVVMGMLNTLPSIPGLQPLVGSLTGFPDITIRRFSYEYLFPFAFVVMMIIVALKHSQYRHYRDIHASGFRRRFGLFMDIALVVMAVVVAVSYVIEIDAICALYPLSDDPGECKAVPLTTTSGCCSTAPTSRLAGRSPGAGSALLCCLALLLLAASRYRSLSNKRVP